MFQQIAIIILRLLELYSMILLIYALSTWLSSDNYQVKRAQYFLKMLTRPITDPIEELFPQLRFFSVFIAMLLISIVRTVVYNAFF